MLICTLLAPRTWCSRVLVAVLQPANIICKAKSPISKCRQYYFFHCLRFQLHDKTLRQSLRFIQWKLRLDSTKDSYTFIHWKAVIFHMISWQQTRCMMLTHDWVLPLVLLP